MNGDGTPLRSYLHQEQLAEWLFKILFEGSNEPITLGLMSRLVFCNLLKK